MPLFPNESVHGAIGVVPIMDRIRNIDNAPNCAWHSDDVKWDPGYGRVCVVMDCQIIVELLNGRAVLAYPDARPLFVRLARMMAELILLDAKPRLDINSFLEWRPRSYNVLTDNLCNVAMDSKSFAQWVNLPALDSRRCHVARALFH